MPKTQAVTRTAKGLYLQYNPVHGVPEGALLEADDVQIDREGVVSKRRGVERYGSTFDPEVVFEFEDTFVGFESGGTAKYDAQGDGSEWRSYSGTFSPPDSSTKIHAQEAQLSWYFTTSDGIYRSDAIATAPTRAGIATGLDLTTARTGTGGSWFTVDKQVAYRIVWGRVDANNVLLIGAPSFRRIVTNAKVGGTSNQTGTNITVEATAHGLAASDIVEISDVSNTTYETGSFTIASITADTFTYPQTGTATGACNLNYGKDYNVQLNFTIPDDMVEGDFYDIYRSQLSASATVLADDNLQKVGRFVLTDSDITAGTITITDNKDTAFLGAALYTNAAVEGIAQQNSRPPFARDVAVFRRHMFFLNTQKPHMAEIELDDVDNLVNDTSSVTITQGATVLEYFFSGSEDIGNQKFERVTSESTTAENVEETMKSFCKVVNRDTNNSIVYAYYISPDDEDPGRVAIEGRTPSVGVFTLTVNNAITSAEFSPTIPTTGTDYSSEEQPYVNRLYRSKIDEFEAVPDFNFYDVGDAAKAGKRILTLRDSLIILKEDGVFRLSGESESNFSVKKLDGTQQIRAPESAVILDNAVWALTDDGVVRISESGTTIMSRQIEDELLKVLTYTNFETITHAVAYDSENKYILFTQDKSTDTTAQVAWCFNILTRAWTRWKLPAKEALVQFTTDKLVLVHSTEEFLVRERKDFADTDFQDESFSISFTDIGTDTDEDGDTITTVDVLFPTRAVLAGWTFHNVPVNLPAFPAIKVENLGENLYRMHLDSYVPALAAGDATLTAGIPSRIKWAPEAVGSLGVMKQFSFVQIYLEDPVARCTFAATSDFFTDETSLLIRDPTSTGSQAIRVPVPRDIQRGRSLSVAFEHSTAGEDFGVFQVSYTVRPYGERTSLVPR